MALTTRSEIRDKIFKRANLEDNDEFLPDEEMNTLINVAIRDYYEHVLDSEIGELFITNAPILTKSGTYSFILPADFYKLRDVSYYDGGKYFPLHKANPSSYPQMTTASMSVRNGYYLMHYDMRTDVWCLKCFPSDLAAANLAVMYIPEPPLYSSDEDQIGFFNGWEEYVVVQCAIWAREKEGSDYTGLQGELAKIMSDISSHASYFDAGRPTLINKLR